MTIQQMRKLRDPVKGFKVGNTREKIEALGRNLMRNLTWRKSQRTLSQQC
jgi:hypothetical protein